MKVAGIGWNEIMVIVMAVGSTEAAQANPVGGRGKVQCSAAQSKCLRLRVGEQEVQVVQLAEWRVAHPRFQTWLCLSDCCLLPAMLGLTLRLWV